MEEQTNGISFKPQQHRVIVRSQNQHQSLLTFLSVPFIIYKTGIIIPMNRSYED